MENPTCSNCHKEVDEILWTYENEDGKWYYFCSEMCMDYFMNMIFPVKGEK